MEDKSDEPQLQIKPMEAYPPSVKKEMKLLQVNRTEDTIKVIGSASYRESLYPSDLDFFEEIYKGSSVDSSIRFFVRNIKRVTYDLVHTKDHYFLELKCGLDIRYIVSLGKCKDGFWTPSKDLVDNLTRMHGLFPEDEYKSILRILNMDKPTQMSYELLSHIIRSHAVLRWSEKEVMIGIKQLPFEGGTISLEEAISVMSPINLEGIAIINGKYSDISNYFVVGYHDEQGQLKVINLPEQSVTDFSTYFKENLKGSVEKLYYSRFEYNPIKLAKRYFSYGRFTHDMGLVDKVTPLLNSPLGFLSQLRSEVGTMMKTLDGVKDIHKTLFKEQLQVVKYKLANMVDLPQKDLIKWSKVVNEISSNQFDKDEIMYVLEEFKDILSSYIDENAIKYLKKVKLVPPPKSMLPKSKVYAGMIA
jgi:hypothetical protein